LRNARATLDDEWLVTEIRKDYMDLAAIVGVHSARGVKYSYAVA
jgi:hypothetical protein